MADCCRTESGPAPSPARAVYGFCLFIASALAAAVYLTWALVPPSWLRAIGLDYWPQQLWALTVPTAFLISLLLFVLVVYPLLGLVGVPALDDPRVHVDVYSQRRRPAAAGSIPPVYDVPLSDVCRRLYVRPQTPSAGTASRQCCDGDGEHNRPS